MKKILLSGVCLLASTTSPLVFSSTTILASIGPNAIVMSDESMQNTRGAALISGQPTPSVTHGLKTHRVTWKGFGSKSDYASYNYKGNDLIQDTSHTLFFSYEGSNYHVGGDRWLADDISAPSAWSLSNAYLKEYHYQILNPSTEAVTTYAFRETTWNRPISTFSW